MYAFGNTLLFCYACGPGASTLWLMGNTEMKDETVIRDKYSN